MSACRMAELSRLEPVAVAAAAHRRVPTRQHRPRSRSPRCAVAPAPRAPAILMAWWLVCPGCPGLLLRPL